MLRFGLRGRARADGNYRRQWVDLGVGRLLAGVAASARFEEVAPFASRISSEIWSISSEAEVIRASESELTFSLVAISRILAVLKSRSSLDFCEM